jgi:hypothetical protein
MDTDLYESFLDILNEEDEEGDSFSSDDGDWN